MAVDGTTDKMVVKVATTNGVGNVVKVMEIVEIAANEVALMEV